ncbi:MAG TPA: fibronectin type III domain-containing protein, partial [Thermoanaerobaculia bacterium]
AIRSKVNSIGVRLIGMNERREAGYSAPGETLAAVREFRQYRLETLVVPRNIQKRGMKEQDTVPPGSPTITSICTGRCGGVYLQWSAPPITAVFGAPDQYKIIYDVASAPGFTCETTTFTNTFGYVFGGDGSCPPLVPDVPYKFRVVALNSFGSGTSPQVTATPKNNTKPKPVVLTSATTTLNGKVTLTWQRPTEDVSGSVTCGPTEPPPAETEGYRVYRRIVGETTWNLIANEDVVKSFGATVTWTDTTAVNCVNYEYNVRLVERCEEAASYNVTGSVNMGISEFPTTPLTGSATSLVAPAPPNDLVINQASLCPASICAVEMSWPKVTVDASGAAITVPRYHIYRKLFGAPDTSWARVGTQNTIPAGPTVSYVDPGVDTNAGKRYQYRITAEQCSLESAPSPVYPFPCAFPAGVIGTPVLLSSTAFDGNGSSSAPYLVASGATVTLNTIDTSRVQSVRFNIYDGSTIRSSTTLSSPPFSVSWTPGDGVLNRVDAVVTETGGCITTVYGYVQDEPAACCLVPRSGGTAAAPVVSYSAGSDFVEITLRNFCSQPLEIQSININWNPALTPSGTKLNDVFFPSTLGGTVFFIHRGSSASFTATPPATTANVPASSGSTY